MGHNNIATDICIHAPTKTVPTKVATGIKEPRDEPRQKRYPLVGRRGGLRQYFHHSAPVLTGCIGIDLILTAMQDECI